MILETWRKKDAPSVTVDVTRLTEDNVEEVANWCGGQIIEERNPEYPEEMQKGLNFQAAGGTTQRASLGMYVAHHNDLRMFMSFRPRVFEHYYEPIGGPEPGEDPNDSEYNKNRTRLGFSNPFDGVPRIS